MLYIISGEPGSGKTHLLYERISASVKENRPSFLIVPEQYTLSAEAELFSLLPPSATLTFEVTNFSRLANTVFRAEGGLSYRYATKTTRALLVWQALRLLSPFFREEHGTDVGNIKKTLSALDELHQAGIHAPDMKKAAMALPDDSRLKARLHDLAMIDTTYKDLLSSKYDDAAEDLDRLALSLKTSRFFSGKALFCDGFTSFTEQEYAILTEIARVTDLYVTLPIASYAEESQAFREPIRTRDRLLSLAKRHAIAVDETRLEGNRRTPSPRLLHVARHLWSADTARILPYKEEDGATSAPSPEEEEDLRLLIAPDPYAAAAWVAADIARRVQGGARFRDFAIVAKNADAYVGILDKALEKNKISYYMSTKIDINSLEAVKMIQTAYAIFRSGYRHADVISFLKCGYSGILDADADLFELYLETWRISGRKEYQREKPWKRHPDGYRNRFSEKDTEKLRRLNETRDALMAPIFALEEESRVAKTVLDHVRALYRFMTALSLPETLREQATASAKAGYRSVAEGQSRLFKTLTDALEGLCDALGEAEASADDFAELLSLTLSDVSMGRIPTSVDECTVGSADLVRIGEKKHVYLFGVNEGEFPSPVSESSLFSESDRAAMQKLGLPLAPDIEIRASRELFSFLRAFSAATETVTLLSASEDSAFGATVPSAAFHRASVLGGVSVLPFSSLSPLVFLYSEAAARGYLGTLSGTSLGKSLENALPDSEDNRRITAMTTAHIIEAACHVDPRLTSKIYGNRFSLTQSQLERFVDCPFSYFCRYVLRLNENEPADFSFRDIGNYIHDALDIFFKVLEERGLSIATATEKETSLAITEACNRAYRSLFPEGSEPSARLSHRIDALRTRAVLFSEELREEFAQSKFSPVFHELSIGERSENGIASTAYCLPDGTRLTLHGKIDRVDAYTHSDGRTYIRVIDYKTGSKVFSPEDLEKGKNLQLFVYLFALCQDEKGTFRRRLGIEEDKPVVPAGMLYMETAAKALPIPTLAGAEEIREAARRSIRRSGYLLDDGEILSAMEPSREGRFIPSTEKKPGDLLSETGFSEVADKLRKTLEDIGGRIRAGHADASPITNAKGAATACEYCPMKAVCRNALVKK